MAHTQHTDITHRLKPFVNFQNVICQSTLIPVQYILTVQIAKFRLLTVEKQSGYSFSSWLILTVSGPTCFLPMIPVRTLFFCKTKGRLFTPSKELKWWYEWWRPYIPFWCCGRPRVTKNIEDIIKSLIKEGSQILHTCKIWSEIQVSITTFPNKGWVMPNIPGIHFEIYGFAHRLLWFLLDVICENSIAQFL